MYAQIFTREKDYNIHKLHLAGIWAGAVKWMKRVCQNGAIDARSQWILAVKAVCFIINVL